jgi:hypothetical protein
MERDFTYIDEISEGIIRQCIVAKRTYWEQLNAGIKFKLIQKNHILMLSIEYDI